ncbi:MAG: hypothetical protein KGV57_00945 [Fusobacterium sp.]|nr:hypothetical protein [Fusobacterium sp.]
MSKKMLLLSMFLILAKMSYSEDIEKIILNKNIEARYEKLKLNELKDLKREEVRKEQVITNLDRDAQIRWHRDKYKKILKEYEEKYGISPEDLEKSIAKQENDKEQKDRLEKLEKLEKERLEQRRKENIKILEDRTEEVVYPDEISKIKGEALVNLDFYQRVVRSVAREENEIDVYRKKMELKPKKIKDAREMNKEIERIEKEILEINNYLDSLKNEIKTEVK